MMSTRKLLRYVEQWGKKNTMFWAYSTVGGGGYGPPRHNISSRLATARQVNATAPPVNQRCREITLPSERFTGCCMRGGGRSGLMQDKWSPPRNIRIWCEYLRDAPGPKRFRGHVCTCGINIRHFLLNWTAAPSGFNPRSSCSNSFCRTAVGGGGWGEPPHQVHVQSPDRGWMNLIKSASKINPAHGGLRLFDIFTDW